MDALLKSSEVSICHFDRREKSILLLLQAHQDFSLRSKGQQKEAFCESVKTDGLVKSRGRPSIPQDERLNASISA